MLSIIVPAYNEEKRIKKTLRFLLHFIGRKAFEVIVVADGADSTASIVSSFARKDKRLVLMRFDHRLGKGGAIMEGLRRAKGQKIVLYDADSAMPPSGIAKLLSGLRSNDVVIGSRYRPDSLARMPFYRLLNGRIFNAFVRLLFFLSFSDAQCGFKAFRAKPVKALLPFFKTKGFMWDLELLLLAREKGLRVAEVPIEWWAVPGGPVSKDKLGTALSIAFDLVKLRLCR